MRRMVDRSDLLGQLESYYRSCGWKVSREEDGVLAAAGPGGVTWHGVPVIPEDLHEPETLEARLAELAKRRMQGGGELCPLDLLPAEGCEDGLQAALHRTRLSERPHVSVYELAAVA